MGLTSVSLRESLRTLVLQQELLHFLREGLQWCYLGLGLELMPFMASHAEFLHHRYKSHQCHQAETNAIEKNKQMN